MQPIQYQTDLTPYNTFGLRAKAQAFIALKHADELRDIVRLPEFNRDTVLWLGGGSNILLMEDYVGLVVHMETREYAKLGVQTAWFISKRRPEKFGMILFCIRLNWV